MFVNRQVDRHGPDHFPEVLPGGEARLRSLAKLLANSPILASEETTAEDPTLSRMKIALVEIQNLLNSAGNQASSSR